MIIGIIHEDEKKCNFAYYYKCANLSIYWRSWKKSFFFLGASRDLVLTRRDLALLYFEQPAKNLDTKGKHLITKLVEKTSCLENNVKTLSKILRPFLFELKTKYISVHRKKDIFLANPKYKNWLDKPVTFPKYGRQISGRPELPFEICSDR